MPEEIRCFLDFSINNTPLPRVIIQLFTSLAPKTCENFRALCTGEQGITPFSIIPLHYKNCIVHRVINNFMIQSGDFENSNGSGGSSIYGRQFDDENFDHKFDRKGLLAMANAGPNTNGSQFFITLNACPHLNGKHVIFGTVLSGMESIHKIESLATDSNDKPLADVRIMNSGQLMKKSKSKKKEKNKKKEEEEENEIKKKKKENDIEAKNEYENEIKKNEQKKRKRVEGWRGIGKSGRELKGRGFQYLRDRHGFGGIGFRSQTPPHLLRRERRNGNDQMDGGYSKRVNRFRDERKERKRRRSVSLKYDKKHKKSRSKDSNRRRRRHRRRSHSERRRSSSYRKRIKRKKSLSKERKKNLVE